MYKLASCDSQGAVYISESAVYRTIVPLHADNVMEVLGLLGDDFEGVIGTVVCDYDSLPPELRDQSTSLTLKHKRVARISYPHEWCATMLKDAAVFHLKLSEKLLEKSLVLKDAHPWNILYDHGRPIFIDFTSIVTEKGLFSEDYLEANRNFKDASNAKRMSMLVREIFERMFQPYFLNPLQFYASGERSRVRSRIENTTLNAATNKISLYECFPKPHISRSMVKKIVRFITSRISENRVYSKLNNTNDLGAFYAEMLRHVQGLYVTTGASAYSNYYGEKNENQDWNYSEGWNAKQKSVHAAINSTNICSVLDVACNTGWYALMAEKLGKSVVAFDIDEGCIEILYDQVRTAQLNVLPLVMNFTQLTKDRYSINDGNRVVINAKQRLRSDAVIALGIIHHLVLGLGMSFNEVLDSLVEICQKRLIIEFIEPEDAMISNEPSFFPAYFNNQDLITEYDIRKLIQLIETRGFNVEVSSSYPETRKLLVCDRLV